MCLMITTKSLRRRNCQGRKQRIGGRLLLVFLLLFLSSILASGFANSSPGNNNGSGGSGRFSSLTRSEFLVAAVATSASIFLLTSRTTTKPAIAMTAEGSADYWEKQWSSGENPSWHSNEIHPSLKKYTNEVLLGVEGFPMGGARILIPFCGKTEDIEFLARFRKISNVVGVDISRQAAVDLAKEHPDLELESVGQKGAFEQWKGFSTTLLIGDFFDLTPSDTGEPFDAVWDHGGLVSVPPEKRDLYVQKLGEMLVKPDGKILLTTYVHPADERGPPYSIDEKDVRKLFEGQSWVKSVDLLETRSATNSAAPWYKSIFAKNQGKEKIFLIKTK